jgi:DDE_Tnp_1-associated
VAAVLALAAAAVVAGSRSFTAIAGWAADVPADGAGRTVRRCGAARPGAGPPSKSTIWRVVTGADTAALDAVTGSWLMKRAGAAGDLAFAGHGGDDDAPLTPVRVDGKTVRGARNPDGSQVHLLAALAGRPGVAAAQAGVAKTNEIPMINNAIFRIGQFAARLALEPGDPGAARPARRDVAPGDGGARSTSASASDLQQIVHPGVIQGWPRATSMHSITLSDREVQGERARSRRYGASCVGSAWPFASKSCVVAVWGRWHCSGPIRAGQRAIGSACGEDVDDEVQDAWPLIPVCEWRTAGGGTEVGRAWQQRWPA